MKRILFVDDEPEILSGLRNLLRRQRRKWQMSFALGGKDALTRLAEERFDVVVSDMRMPEIDGVAVLTEAQKRHPDATRIILSGYANQGMALRATAVAHQYLSKPCDAATLENVLQRACDLQDLIGDGAIREIVGRIDKLPVLPRIYTELTRALANERTMARDVAAILEQDMAVCAKLLQMVNSAFFRLAREITSIEEAVAYLGLETVKSLVLAAKVFAVPAPLSQLDRFSISALQEHALHVAMLGKEVAPKSQGDDVFTAAMLHDIGLLILALALPDLLGEALARARREGRPLHELEYDLYGTSHGEIGAYLLGLWGLPYPVVEAVANHHRPRRVPQQEFDLLAAVYTADCLAREAFPSCALCQLGGPLPEDQSYWQALGVAEPLERWREMAHRQAAECEEKHP